MRRFSWVAQQRALLSACVVVLFLVVPAYAANITLVYSECYTVNSTLQVCAPSDRTLNDTAIYRQVFSDLAGNFSVAASLKTDFIGVKNELAANYTDLKAFVSRIQGINNTEQYVACLLELNASKTIALRWQGESERKTAELNIAKDGTIPKADLETCQTSLVSLQSLDKSREEEKTQWLVGGLLVGAGIMSWYLRRTPSPEKGLREGRPERMGKA